MCLQIGRSTPFRSTCRQTGPICPFCPHPTTTVATHPASIWDHLRPSRPFPIPRNHRSGAVTGGMPDVAATESVGGVAESRGGAGLIAPAPGRAPTPHLHSASIRDHVQPFRPFVVPLTHRDRAAAAGGMPVAALGPVGVVVGASAGTKSTASAPGFSGAPHIHPVSTLDHLRPSLAPQKHRRVCTVCQGRHRECVWPVGASQCDPCVLDDQEHYIGSGPACAAAPKNQNDNRPRKRKLRVSSSSFGDLDDICCMDGLATNTTFLPKILMGRICCAAKIGTTVRVSFAQPTFSKITTPPTTALFLQRDRALLSNLLRGHVPTFSESDWDGVLRDWTLRMSRYKQIAATFVSTYQCVFEKSRSLC